MMRILGWCMELGVTCVTAYAFSVDNFARVPAEVRGLMELAREKMQELARHQGVLAEHGVVVRVVGELQLLPRDVQAAAQRLMDATRGNGDRVLNICLGYTSRHELARAVRGARERRRLGVSARARPTEHELDAQLQTAGSPPVDLLVRTSGETRLSDFLTRQVAFATLHFTPRLWPELGFLDFALAVVQYQREAPLLRAARAASTSRPAAAGPRWSAPGCAAPLLPRAAAHRGAGVPGSRGATWSEKKEGVSPARQSGDSEGAQDRHSSCSEMATRSYVGSEGSAGEDIDGRGGAEVPRGHAS
ncbi:unnamed protein product [Pedinophyceae sp. YPF-701]|nr:unnamed protein product [Pedinophyceae sp. YPF-701]